MVKPFQINRLPVLHFGPGQISRLPPILSRYGSRILNITGKSSFIDSPFATDILGHLKKEGFTLFTEKIPGEPTPEMVDTICSIYRDEGIDVVVGIGGGSALDAGKAVSAMLRQDQSVMNFLEGVGAQTHNGDKIPYIAIPTTAGTGSEATKNAVLSRPGIQGFKKSLRHENFVPDHAIVDPQLSLSCPPEITAATGMDAFTQLLESYTSTQANSFTDALAFQGLRGIKLSLKQAFHHGNDLKARTNMAFSAYASGISLAYAGLGVIHGFASSVGALYDIPHGVICGTLMAPVNQFIVENLLTSGQENPAYQKYLNTARLFIEDKTLNESDILKAFVAYLHELSHELGLTGLCGYGFGETRIEDILNNTSLKNNPVKLSHKNLKQILYKVI